MFRKNFLDSDSESDCFIYIFIVLYKKIVSNGKINNYFNNYNIYIFCASWTQQYLSFSYAFIPLFVLITFTYSQFT